MPFWDRLNLLTPQDNIFRGKSLKGTTVVYKSSPLFLHGLVPILGSIDLNDNNIYICAACILCQIPLWAFYVQYFIWSSITLYNWRRAWQPTPVFLPGKFHGQRSLAGYSPWGCKGSATTELRTHTQACNSRHKLRTLIYRKVSRLPFLYNHDLVLPIRWLELRVL